jgi:uncharacterized protein YceK
MKKAVPVLLLALAGCGTISDLAGAPNAKLKGPSPHVFGGTRIDSCLAAQLACPKDDAFLCCLAWIDWPLSAALDVALLPVTVPWALIRGTP